MCVLVYVTAYEFGGGGGVREERAGGEIAVARRDGERGGSAGEGGRQSWWRQRGSGVGGGALGVGGGEGVAAGECAGVEALAVDVGRCEEASEAREEAAVEGFGCAVLDGLEGVEIPLEFTEWMPWA